MLTTEMSAGVALGHESEYITQQCTMQTRKSVMDFKRRTQDRRHLKSKTGVSVAHKKGLVLPSFFFKKSL